MADLSGTVSRVRFAAFRVAKYHHREGLSFKITDWVPPETLRATDEAINNEEDTEQKEIDLPDVNHDARERNPQTSARRPRAVFDGVYVPKVLERWKKLAENVESKMNGGNGGVETKDQGGRNDHPAKSRDPHGVIDVPKIRNKISKRDE